MYEEEQVVDGRAGPAVRYGVYWILDALLPTGLHCDVGRPDGKNNLLHRVPVLLGGTPGCVHAVLNVGAVVFACGFVAADVVGVEADPFDERILLLNIPHCVASHLSLGEGTVAGNIDQLFHRLALVNFLGGVI